MPKIPKPDLSDALVLLGVLVAAVGLYELSPWAVLVLGGGLFMLIGLRLSS